MRCPASRWLVFAGVLLALVPAASVSDRLEELVVMDNPAESTASSAPVSCDLLVVGGGLGGCAAALSACRLGCDVWMTEECDWIGGQITSQGVSALDEHRFIETFGGTASYAELRTTIRALARERYRFREDLDDPHLNPGGGWVSRLCFEPRLGLAALQSTLQPHLDEGRLHILTGRRAVAAETDGDRIRSVTVEDREGGRETFHPRMVIDATELGDLLPLAGVEHVVGAEPRSETDEPQGHPGDGNPRCQQSFTFTFAVEHRPGEEHTIDCPEGYDDLRDRQPFSFDADYGGSIGRVSYGMFEKRPHTYGPFWTYRRLLDASQLDDPRYPNDVAMINWSGNDYRDRPLVGDDPAAALREAKRLGLAFLYWLQTEAPRDDGGRGYPELMLRPDVMGTEDGLSQYPYVRESRRIRALTTVREHDISAPANPAARARRFEDSVGVGFYPIDIHGCGEEETASGAATRPFQVPMGALIPVRVRNLLAGCKNIGTTHVSNGAYRLHPVEWNIGEAAGAIAAAALETGRDPAGLWDDRDARRAVQDQLIDTGVPLSWFVDVPVEHPAFAALQRLAIRGIVAGDASRLTIDADRTVDRATARAWFERAGGSDSEDPSEDPTATRGWAGERLAALAHGRGAGQRADRFLAEGRRHPDREVTRGEMILWIDRALLEDEPDGDLMTSATLPADLRAVPVDGLPISHDFTIDAEAAAGRWRACEGTTIGITIDADGLPGLEIEGTSPAVEIDWRRDLAGYRALEIRGDRPPRTEIRATVTDIDGRPWTGSTVAGDGDDAVRLRFADLREPDGAAAPETAGTGPYTVETLRLAWSCGPVRLRRVALARSTGWEGPAVAIAENPPVYEQQDWDRTASDCRDLGFTAAHFVVIGGRSPVERQRAAVDAFHRAGLLCMMRLFPTTDFAMYDAHPEWRQQMLDGGSRHDWRVYLCPNHPEFADAIVEQVRGWLAEVPYDGIELAEPWFEVWGGPAPDNPQRGHYACVCDHCCTAFRERVGVDARALLDPESESWYRRPENAAAYHAWVDFRVDTVLRFSAAILDAARETRPGIVIGDMHLSDIRQEPGAIREYQAQDLEASLRRLRPDILTIQDAWQDWTRTDLSPSFVDDYARAYAVPLAASSPGLIVKAHADIGSLPPMRRSHTWMRRFSAHARAGGFAGPVYYEYTLGDWRR